MAWHMAQRPSTVSRTMFMTLVPAGLARSFRHWTEAGDGSPTEAF